MMCNSSRINGAIDDEQLLTFTRVQMGRVQKFKGFFGREKMPHSSGALENRQAHLPQPFWTDDH